MDTSTLAVAIAYANKVGERVSREGFKIQVEQDRSILETTGQPKILYLIPKTSTDTNNYYEEYVYTSGWEKVGDTKIDLTSYGTSLSVNDTILSLLNSNGDELSSVDISGRTDIDNCIVILSSNSFVYDGASKVPTVTSVTLSGTTLTQDEDYIVSAYPETNAGHYILRIYGIGDYKGSKAIDWNITKAVPTVTGAASIKIDTLNETKEVAYTTNSDGIMSFSIENPTYASVTSINNTATITSIALGNTNLIISLTEGANFQSYQTSIPLTILNGMCYGVSWNYGLASPQLIRLTRENDPNGKVTHSPDVEPTAGIGTTPGSSWFDDYLPYSGMIRKNYVNGEIVDFTGYDNGETYVYIPKFWSKIIDDAENSRLYIYISAVPAEGFTLHPGSGHYMSRYECNSDFLSAPGTAPKVNTNLATFRANIGDIYGKKYQYDIHTYNALQLLYLVEFCNFNTQGTIGAGITSGSAKNVGETDILTYHTGRVDGTDNVSAVQYRWIENLWGNVWNWVDGVLIQDGLVYICDDYTKYSSTITSDYINIGLTTPTGYGFYKTSQVYNNCYLIPATIGGSDSTYTCDYYYYDAGLRSLYVGGTYSYGSSAGLFDWNSYSAPGNANAGVGGRALLIDTDTNI